MEVVAATALAVHQLQRRLHLDSCKPGEPACLSKHLVLRVADRDTCDRSSVLRFQHHAGGESVLTVHSQAHARTLTHWDWDSRKVVLGWRCWALLQRPRSWSAPCTLPTEPAHLATPSLNPKLSSSLQTHLLGDGKVRPQRCQPVQDRRLHWRTKISSVSPPMIYTRAPLSWPGPMWQVCCYEAERARRGGAGLLQSKQQPLTTFPGESDHNLRETQPTTSYCRPFKSPALVHSQPAHHPMVSVGSEAYPPSTPIRGEQGSICSQPEHVCVRT